MEKVLIIRSAPFANIAYAVKSLLKDYGALKLTALAQPEVASVFDKDIGVDDFILYRHNFLKLYHLVFLLPKVMCVKFDSVVMFYNNEARKGYRHAEIFCLLCFIPHIILCNENGSREVLTRGQFFSQIILGSVFKIVSDIVAFFLFISVFFFLWIVSGFLKILRIR